MGQCLLDIIEDAIVVFSRSGVLTFSNAAYRDMWNQNPEAAFADVTIRDCISVWQTKATERVDWCRVETFVKALEDPATETLAPASAEGHEVQLRCIAPGTCGTGSGAIIALGPCF